jgi:predicted transcriptional regulator
MSQQTLEHPEQSSTESTTTIPATFTVPDGLDSTGSKLVYLYLDASNGGDISALRESLGMKTISVYPILQTLVSKGLVERDGEQYHVVA